MISEPALRTANPRAVGLSGRRLPVTWLAVVMLVGVIGLVGAGTLPRVRRHHDLEVAARAVKDGVPVVSVILPVRGKPVAEFTLPGTIQAIQETAIYARADGYLKRRLVDIGDRVVAGQVLAEIDTPELDQQLYQAKATLAQAQAARAQAVASLDWGRSALVHNQAQLGYDGTNLSRWRTLKERELVAQQDVDDRQVLVTTAQADVRAAQANVVALEASVTAADANVMSNQANVQRLLEMQSFQKIRPSWRCRRGSGAVWALIGPAPCRGRHDEPYWPVWIGGSLDINRRRAPQARTAREPPRACIGLTQSLTASASSRMIASAFNGLRKGRPSALARTDAHNTTYYATRRRALKPSIPSPVKSRTRLAGSGTGPPAATVRAATYSSSAAIVGEMPSEKAAEVG
jgi:hypothetical protein